MKFVTYDNKNAAHIPAKTGRKKMSIRMRTSGTIILSASLIAELGIKNGGGIVFLQDSNYPSDWYIKRSDNPQSFKVSITDKKGFGKIKSNQLVSIIRKSVDTTLDSFSMNVFQDPQMSDCFALATAKIESRR